MQFGLEINILFGSVISILLSVITYFIKQLHSDFRRMEKDLTEVKATTQLIKTEFKSSYDLLNQKVEFLETRVKNLETFTLKIIDHEK